MSDPFDSLKAALPSTLPIRAPAQPHERLPRHLRRDFSAEIMLLDKALETGRVVLHFQQKSAALAQRNLLYNARVKERHTFQDELKGVRFDRLFISTLQVNPTTWALIISKLPSVEDMIVESE